MAKFTWENPVELLENNLNPANPESRGDEKKLQQTELYRDIKFLGKVVMPVIMVDGESADGEGRIKVAKDLGIKTIPVLWYSSWELQERDATMMMFTLNPSQRSIANRAYLESVHESKESDWKTIQKIGNRAVRNKFKRVLKLFGPEIVKELYDNPRLGNPDSVIRYVINTGNVISDNQFECNDELWSREDRLQFLRWVRDGKHERVTDLYTAAKVAPAIVKAKFTNFEPVSLGKDLDFYVH